MKVTLPSVAWAFAVGTAAALPDHPDSPQPNRPPHGAGHRVPARWGVAIRRLEPSGVGPDDVADLEQLGPRVELLWVWTMGF